MSDKLDHLVSEVASAIGYKRELDDGTFPTKAQVENWLYAGQRDLAG